MNVIGFQGEGRLLVSMTKGELRAMSGLTHDRDFKRVFGFEPGTQLVDTAYSRSFSDKEREMILKVKDIPVTQLVDTAKAVLDTYSGLKTKLESVRNQIAFLTNQMEPEEE